MNQQNQWLFETPSQSGVTHYSNPDANSGYYGYPELESEWETLIQQPSDRRVDMKPLEIVSHFPFKAMGGTKVRSGNQVDFFIDGPKTFEAMVRAIKTATGNQHYIYLLGWWLTDCFPLIPSDPTSTIAQLFANASRKGVQIRVILWDQFGRQNSAEVNRIKALPNGEAILDNDTLRFGSHHQKILVVSGMQGLIGFCGGVDINPDRVVSNPKLAFPGCMGGGSSNSNNNNGSLVIGSSGGVSNSSSGAIVGAPLHDIHCQIRGPAAHDLLFTFIQRWKAHPAHTKIDAAKGALRGLREPIPASIGKQFVRIARTLNLVTPRKCITARSVRSTTVAAIRSARKFIYIEDQYLVSMEAAAELRKILPKIQHLTIVIPHSSISDMPQVWARRKAFIDFLKSGPHAQKVRIFYLVTPTSGGFGSFTYVHAKMWIIDDEIAIIGSANCNRRGWSYDSEANAVIYDGPPVKSLPLPFAQRLRVALWARLLNVAPPRVLDGVASAPLWLKPPRGAWIRPYNQNAGKDPASHKLISWDSIIDPSGDSLPACPGGVETEVGMPVYAASAENEFRPSRWERTPILR
jgi:phosphatidylserine/phosphatidylglycerophosphate/cardiolipin synthase-like enzyme